MDEQASKSQTSPRKQIRSERTRGKALLANEAHSSACRTPALPGSKEHESDERPRMVAYPLGQLRDGPSSVESVLSYRAPGQPGDEREMLGGFIS
jgi:hypothetical protein